MKCILLFYNLIREYESYWRACIILFALLLAISYIFLSLHEIMKESCLDDEMKSKEIKKVLNAEKNFDYFPKAVNLAKTLADVVEQMNRQIKDSKNRQIEAAIKKRTYNSDNKDEENKLGKKKKIPKEKKVHRKISILEIEENKPEENKTTEGKEESKEQQNVIPNAEQGEAEPEIDIPIKDIVPPIEIKKPLEVHEEIKPKITEVKEISPIEVKEKSENEKEAKAQVCTFDETISKPIPTKADIQSQSEIPKMIEQKQDPIAKTVTEQPTQENKVPEENSPTTQAHPTGSYDSSCHNNKSYQQNQYYAKYVKKMFKPYQHKHATMYLKKTQQNSPSPQSSTEIPPTLHDFQLDEGKQKVETLKEQIIEPETKKEDIKPTLQEKIEELFHSDQPTPIKQENVTSEEEEKFTPNVDVLERPAQSSRFLSGFGVTYRKKEKKDTDNVDLNESIKKARKKDGETDSLEEGSEKGSEHEPYKTYNPFESLEFKLPIPFMIKEEEEKNEQEQERTDFFAAFNEANSIFGQQSYFTESHPLIRMPTTPSAISELSVNAVEFVPRYHRKGVESLLETPAVKQDNNNP